MTDELPPGLQVDDLDDQITQLPVLGVPPTGFTISLPQPLDRMVDQLHADVQLADGRTIPAGQTVFCVIEATLEARWHAGNFWIFEVLTEGTPRSYWVHQHSQGQVYGKTSIRPLWERIPDVDAPIRSPA